jgi:hypothetical protein
MRVTDIANAIYETGKKASDAAVAPVKTVQDALKTLELAKINFQREQEQGIPLQRYNQSAIGQALNSLVINPAIDMGNFGYENTKQIASIPGQMLGMLPPNQPLSPSATRGRDMAMQAVMTNPDTRYLGEAVGYLGAKGKDAAKYGLNSLDDAVKAAKTQPGGLQAGYVDPSYSFTPAASMANSNFKPIDQIDDVSVQAKKIAGRRLGLDNNIGKTLDTVTPDATTGRLGDMKPFANLKPEQFTPEAISKSLDETGSTPMNDMLFHVRQTKYTGDIPLNEGGNYVSGGQPFKAGEVYAIDKTKLDPNKFITNTSTGYMKYNGPIPKSAYIYLGKLKPHEKFNLGEKIANALTDTVAQPQVSGAKPR